MEDPVKYSTEAFSPSKSIADRIPTTQELKWAGARLLFDAYIGFALLTVVGGFITAPVMTYYFFGDWRFWRHGKSALGLFPHGYRMLFRLLKRESKFMLAVPLISPPQTAPSFTAVRLSDNWEHGNSCDTCSRCCEKISCPILNERTGLCRGYNSFYWRYFNCGRFPSHQREIDYYSCPKWEMKPNKSRSNRVA